MQAAARVAGSRNRAVRATLMTAAAVASAAGVLSGCQLRVLCELEAVRVAQLSKGPRGKAVRKRCGASKLNLGPSGTSASDAHGHPSQRRPSATGTAGRSKRQAAETCQTRRMAQRLGAVRAGAARRCSRSGPIRSICRVAQIPECPCKACSRVCACKAGPTATGAGRGLGRCYGPARLRGTARHVCPFRMLSGRVGTCRIGGARPGPAQSG